MKVYMVPFLCGPLSLRIKLKITAVFRDQKVVFVVQERLSSLALIHTCYLTYMNLKEVVDLFLRSTQVDLSLAALLKDRDDTKILQQT